MVPNVLVPISSLAAPLRYLFLLTRLCLQPYILLLPFDFYHKISSYPPLPLSMLPLLPPLFLPCCLQIPVPFDLLISAEDWYLCRGVFHYQHRMVLLW